MDRKHNKSLVPFAKELRKNMTHYEGSGQEHDAERDAYLRSYGLTVIRIPNNEIHDNFDGVCAYLQMQIAERCP